MSVSVHYSLGFLSLQINWKETDAVFSIGAFPPLVENLTAYHYAVSSEDHFCFEGKHNLRDGRVDVCVPNENNYQSKSENSVTNYNYLSNLSIAILFWRRPRKVLNAPAPNRLENINFRDQKIPLLLQI